MNNPSRNRIAEHHLKKMIVVCQEVGCNAQLPYGKMKQHIDDECQAVQVTCPYQRLGCNWTGTRGNVNHHAHIGINFDSLLNEFQ